MAATEDEQQLEAPSESPAQVDPSGRWTRTNDILGKGAFKTVYKGFDELEGLEIAWNQIRMNELVSTKEDRDRLFAEIRVLKQLKHKNIMTFHDSWLEKQGYTVNFITELFTSGTLRQYRKRHRFVDSEVMKRWAWQILCGLVYLHGHTPPIIHRDLKCDNIFINGSEGVVKIGDLGLATMLRARTAPQSVLGTPEFMAPELYDEQYDDRVDVYSFGMCLLELATLEYPYSECRNAAQIYRKGVRPKALERVANRGLAEFILHCIQPLETRPKSRQLLKHHYFNSIRAERMTLKLGAEALGLPVPKENESHPDLQDYAVSAGSSSVSRTSSAAGEMHHDTSFILDAVPEEGDDAASTSSKAGENGSRGPPSEHGSLSEARREEQGGAPDQSPQPLPKSNSIRDFKVKGKLQEDEDKLSLRLRILQDDRAPKVVEFEFDLASDTAISVASEMVEEMSLSHSDAAIIAQAIKEEIFNLTHAAAHHQRHISHAGAASFGSASDDEGPQGRGHALSEGGMTGTSEAYGQESAATYLKFDASNLGMGGTSACSDSVMSVHDAHDDPLSPHHPRPITTAVCSGPFLSTSLPADGYGTLGGDTPMGSATVSLGCSPTSDPMLIDAPPPSAPLYSGAGPSTTSYPPQPPSRPLTPSGLPPPSSISRTRSEGLLRRLARTDSANQANEVEALQQALSQKGTSRLLANLPKEEDRRLPLKKLLESMKELNDESNAQQLLPPRTVSMTQMRNGPPLRVETAPGQLEPLMLKDRGQLTPRAISTPPSGGNRVDGRPPDLRRMSVDSGSARGSLGTSSAQTSPVQASSSSRTLEGMQGHIGSHSASAAQQLLQSTWSTSPRQEPGGAGVHAPPQRSKSRPDLDPEARELRLQAAQTALNNMENKSLLGLDDFGVSRGCKQKQPIKSLMGLGKI